MEKTNLNLMLGDAIEAITKDALRVMSKNPAMAGFLLETLNNQKKAEKLRAKNNADGITVPPYMIISVTDSCNLRCKGCYSRAQHRQAASELSIDRLRSLIGEARELGVSFVFLAGGEPLLRLELLDVAGEFPEIIFPLFTNGLLITDDITEKLRKLKNVVPVISIEGGKSDTDGRRGEGVHERISEVQKKLYDRGVFYGLSFTVTSENFDTLTDESFIDNLTQTGCRLFFFVEYVPIRENTESLVINDLQRKELSEIITGFKKRFSGLFVSFPGDEEKFGGCLSSGRGFIHISAAGDLEPCPFAPYSDTSVKNTPLRDALRSRLLSKIRENSHELNETHGGCALWEKRDWVKSLIN